MKDWMFCFYFRALVSNGANHHLVWRRKSFHPLFCRWNVRCELWVHVLFMCLMNIHSAPWYACFIWNYLRRKTTSHLFRVTAILGSGSCSVNLVQVWWKLPVIKHVTTLCNHIRREGYGNEIIAAVLELLTECEFKDKMCSFHKTENMESWQRLQNCVKLTTHLSMWMQPRQLTPCDMLIFPAKWLYFSHFKLALCPWHWRFEMVKSREESERDPAHSVCIAFRATVALKLRGAEKRRREKEREIGRCWEKEKKRIKNKRKSRQPWFSVTPP